MKWINVNDSLPEDGEEVLFSVAPNGVPFTRIGLYSGGEWKLLCGMWNDYRTFTSKTVWPVTHWMPLPTVEK